MDENQVQHENIAAGLVGALLFSLSGGVIYVVMYQIGVIASIAGFIGVILAIKGYGLMAKKKVLSELYSHP